MAALGLVQKGTGVVLGNQTMQEGGIPRNVQLSCKVWKINRRQRSAAPRISILTCRAGLYILSAFSSLSL